MELQPLPFESCSLQDHTRALRLASELNIPWIRPAALYACMSSDIPSIVESFAMHLIVIDDLKDCLTLKERFRDREWQMFDRMVRPKNCIKESKCRPVREALWKKLVVRKDDRVNFLVGVYPVLSSYRLRFCGSCYEQLDHTTSETRKSVIADLYGTKGLESVDLMKLEALALRH